MSEKSETNERVLNDSPAQEYCKQVCVDCKDFYKNNGRCVANPGDILQCLQIREKNLQHIILHGTEDMFGKFFSSNSKCTCKGSELADKLGKEVHK